MRLTILFCIIFTNTLFAQWDNFYAPDSLPQYYSFDQVLEYSSKYKLYACSHWGANILFTSDDGGKTFQIKNGFCFFQQFAVVNDTVCFAIKKNNNVDYINKLYKSIDRGKTFFEISIISINGDTGMTKSEMQDLFFYDMLNGWVLGNDTTGGCNEIWTTNDGGITWQKTPCENIKMKTGLFDATQGYYKGWKKVKLNQRVLFLDSRDYYNCNKIIMADNYGKYWSEIQVDTNYFKLWGSVRNLSFKDSLIGMVTLAQNDTSLLVTKDGGTTWKTVSGITFISTIDYAKPTANQKGYFISCNNYGCLVSYDDGKNWYQLDVWSHNNIRFYDAETGISVNQNTLQPDDIKVFNGWLPKELGIDEKTEQTIKLYPNPATNNITLSTSANTSITQINMVDIIGKKYLLNYKKENNNFIIDVSELPTGIYFLQATTTNGVMNKKVLIEK